MHPRLLDLRTLSDNDEVERYKRRNRKLNERNRTLQEALAKSVKRKPQEGVSNHAQPKKEEPQPDNSLLITESTSNEDPLHEPSPPIQKNQSPRPSSTNPVHSPSTTERAPHPTPTPTSVARSTSPLQGQASSPDLINGRKKWNRRTTWDRPHYGCITRAPQHEIDNPPCDESDVIDDDDENMGDSSKPKKVVRGGSVIQIWFENFRGQLEHRYGIVSDLRARKNDIKRLPNGKTWAENFIAIVNYFIIQAEDAIDQPMMAYLRGEEWVEEGYSEALRKPHYQWFPSVVCLPIDSNAILDTLDPGFIVPVASGHPPPAPPQRWFRYVFNPAKAWAVHGEFWSAHDPDGRLHWPFKIPGIHDWTPSSGILEIDREEGWNEPRYVDEQAEMWIVPEECELDSETIERLNADVFQDE